MKLTIYASGVIQFQVDHMQSAGLDDLRLLIAGAPEFLTVDGHLVLEIGADQGGAVLDLLVAHGYRDAVIQPDLAGLDRAAVARRPS